MILMKILPFFIGMHLFCIAQDPWKGDDYAKNSDSQLGTALDFMQDVTFFGNEAVLDVGAGDGKISAFMARNVPRGYVYGVDISPSMVQTAKNAFPQIENLTFTIGNASKLNFIEEFDLVTSFTVMQWVLEQKEALECFHRALKKGGRLWLQTPIALPTPMQKALAKTLSSDAWSSHYKDFSPPWRFYTLDEYLPLLEQAKFFVTKKRIVQKHETFPSREAFHGFLRQWFPYLRVLNESEKDLFLKDLLDAYFEVLPLDSQGRACFNADRMEIQAIKT